eukprot:TCONS_00008769-protein
MMNSDIVEQEVHWFWTESFWLPPGRTWKDYESTDTLTKANFRDLYFIPIYVIMLTCVRFLFERYIAKPFCVYLGIENKTFERNKLCELVYDTVTKYPKTKEYEAIAKETGMTTSEVNSWFRRRRASSKNSKMNKATETCWRAFVYLLLFIYGLLILAKSDWFMDHSTWLPGYINHPFTIELKVYYFAEISFYFSLLFSQFYDTKRKDFLQQFIHHVVTLTLLLGSFLLSAYRFGAIIMFIHDTADFWLESAKLTNYAKLQKVCDVLFGIFAILFFVTRLIYYPGWVAYAFFHYNNESKGIVFNTLVCLCFVLLFLNFYWGFLVLKLAYKVLFSGKGASDTRSDTEDSSGSED